MCKNKHREVLLVESNTRKGREKSTEEVREGEPRRKRGIMENKRLGKG